MLPSQDIYLSTGLVPTPSPPQDTLCPICTDTPATPVSLTSCRHIFCHSCITEWLTQPLRNTCPTCREVLFHLDSPLLKPPNERLVLMSHAMTYAGLLGGNYLRFSDEIHISISELYRAAAQANLWLGEEVYRAGVGPAVVESARLGTQIVAMGNLLRGFARASGRPYTDEQTREWKVLVKGVFEVVKRWDGRRMDAIVFPAEMKRELATRGLVSQAFFEGDVQLASLRADLDVLLQYLSMKTVDAYTAREAMRATLNSEPSVLYKVSAWFMSLGR